MSAEKAQWFSVMALAVGAFIFNTSEYIPIALLSNIGKSFAMPATEVGMMITVYAWIVALLSLPLMLLTRNMERKRLLLALFAVFVLGHLLSFVAWSFPVLLLSRISIALTHAVFWSITASLAIRVAPKGKGNQALGLLSTGTVMAMIAGIPLGRMVGEAFGWQLSLLLIGLCAAVVMAVLMRYLPTLPSINSGSIRSLPVLFRRKNLLLLYVLTVLTVTAHFATYSYIEPFVLHIGKFRPEQVTILLGIYGGAGFAASYIFGKWFARAPRWFLVGAVALIMLITALLLPLATSVLAVYALCWFWGIAISIVSLGMMAKVLDFAADATDVANSIYSGLYNVGIGGGALLGHYVSATWGLPHIAWTGAGVAAVAFIVACALAKRADFSQKISA